MNHNRIKDDFQKLPLPPPDSQRIKQTVNLARTEFLSVSRDTGLSFWAFLRVQIRFISYKMWLSQLILLSIFVTLIASMSTAELQTYNALFTVLASLSPLLAFCGFSELLKSVPSNMEEIEMVTRYSTLRLTIARFIIVATVDLFCLTVIILATSIATGLVISTFILYLLVPFLLTLAACLTVMNKLHGQYDNTICAGVSVLCSALFFALSFNELAYAATSISSWVIIFIVTVFYGAYELFYTTKRLKGELLWNRQ